MKVIYILIFIFQVMFVSFSVDASVDTDRCTSIIRAIFNHEFKSFLEGDLTKHSLGDVLLTVQSLGQPKSGRRIKIDIEFYTGDKVGNFKKFKGFIEIDDKGQNVVRAFLNDGVKNYEGNEFFKEYYRNERLIKKGIYKFREVFTAESGSSHTRVQFMEALRIRDEMIQGKEISAIVDDDKRLGKLFFGNTKDRFFGEIFAMATQNVNVKKDAVIETVIQYHNSTLIIRMKGNNVVFAFMTHADGTTEVGENAIFNFVKKLELQKDGRMSKGMYRISSAGKSSSNNMNVNKDMIMIKLMQLK